MTSRNLASAALAMGTVAATLGEANHVQFRVNEVGGGTVASADVPLPADLSVGVSATFEGLDIAKQYTVSAATVDENNMQVSDFKTSAPFTPTEQRVTAVVTGVTVS